jgi:hypothetical protein
MMFGMDSFNWSPILNFNSETQGPQQQNEPSFSNTESWVKNAFLNHYNNCWGVNFGGYTIKTIHAISQRATPSPNQDTPNENTYQWDIRYTWLGSDGSEGEDCQTFFYKTIGVYDYSGDKWEIPDCKHYFNNGRAGSCLASGSGFTTLGAGETEADVFVLKTQYACPGQSSSKYHAKLYHNAKTGEWKVEKFPCDPWSSNSIGYEIYTSKEEAESGIQTEWKDVWDKEEAERKAKEEADRLAKEEADRLAKEEAERKAKEEADRKAKEEADKLAQKEPMVYTTKQETNVIPIAIGAGILLTVIVIMS